MWPNGYVRRLPPKQGIASSSCLEYPYASIRMGICRIQDCIHRRPLSRLARGAACARHGCLDPGLSSVVSTCLRTPTPRPRVLGGPGGSTSSEDGYHNHSTSTYPGPCGSCMVTPCGMRTRNLRIRGPTPCPLGQGGCDARNRSWNHKRSIHVYPIREAGTTRHTYRKCT